MTPRDSSEWEESTPSAGASEDSDERDSSTKEEEGKTSFSEGVIEFARLGRHWLDLTVQQALYALRAHLSESLALFGMFLLGGLLMLGGIAFLDVLLYRWLFLALESVGWALFLLGMVHVAVGGILIRVAWIHLRGDEEP